MKSQFRLLAAGAALAMSVAGLAGCAGDRTETAAAGDGGGDYEVVFIEQNTGNVYFDRMAEGMQKAADDLGFTLTVTGPSTAGAADQVPIIEDQITKGVDAILIQATDPAAVQAALKKAVAKGIEVFTVNQDELAEVREAAVTPLDFSIVSKEQLDLLSELMGGEGEFAILSATTTAPFQKSVVDGIEDLLENDPAYAKLKLVKVAYGDDEPQKSTTETQALMSAYPNLKALLSPTTVGLSAAAQAVASSGRAGDLIVTGLGTPDQMRKFVEDGTVEAFQLWNPSDQGTVAAYLAYQTLEGEVDPSPGTTFDVSDFGTMEINEDGVVFVADELTTFNADNIDDFHF